MAKFKGAIAQESVTAEVQPVVNQNVAITGTPSTGTNGNASHGQVEYLPEIGTKPNVKWEYKWSPERIEFSETKGGWVYKLARLHIVPGLEGIGRDEANKQEAVIRSANRGFTQITIGDYRLGEFKDYVVNYPLIVGRQHMPMWTTPKVIGNRRTIWVTDRAMEKRFHEILIERGICPAIDPYMISEMIRKQENRVANIEGDLASNPSHPRILSRYERNKRTLALMKGEDADAALKEARELVAAMRAGKA